MTEKHCAFSAANGAFLFSVSNLELVELNDRHGLVWVQGDFDARHRLHGDDVLEMPERPSQYHQFNYQTGEWVDTRDTAFYEAEARAKRQQLLAASDWTQLPDVPMTTKEAWATYRQALRDITAQAGFPMQIVWPTTPA